MVELSLSKVNVEAALVKLSLTLDDVENARRKRKVVKNICRRFVVDHLIMTVK